MSERQREAPQTSVVVVAISSVAHIRRCLIEIERQCDLNSCEIIVSVDPRLRNLDGLAAQFPNVVFLSKADADSPVTLTSAALERARGKRVVLTEDSCIADADWLNGLIGTELNDCGAIGGSIEVTRNVSDAMWAFAYVDFFRYMKPVRRGSSSSLSVCNVAYSAEHLDAVHDTWRDGFHETNVHSALVGRFGQLLLNPDARVNVGRNVRVRDAINERYAFGRLFGATRISRSGAGKRFSLALLSLGLPFLLTGRMILKSTRDPHLFRRFVKALPVILVFVLAWSWGELLGYVTGTLPKRTSTAPEIA